MKEGWFINYKSGRQFPIHEHEMWLRAKGNARKLGVSPAVIAEFGKFKPVREREKFLLYVMQNAPVMRVRGHGSHVTFEFFSRSTKAPLESAWLWGQEEAGPFTNMLFVNFATKEKSQMNFGQLDKLMESGEPMRYGAKFRMRKEFDRAIEPDAI
jgi:hypothetical protein